LSGLQQRYNQWQSDLAQLELAQAQSGDYLQLAQPAQPAAKPLRPIVLLYTGVGLLVGLLLGMLLAILFERLDTRMRTPEEITQVLGWPVLATTWRVKASEQKDMINPTGHSGNVEAYRILRTNIGFASIDKPLRSLLITSAFPREGKSITAANLAIFMARAGKNTLLIDADLHRPTLQTLFGLSNTKLGLSNAVLALSMPGVSHTSSYHHFIARTSPETPHMAATGYSLEPFIHSLGIPNLWFMPSGPLPPNPSELLESKVMQRFLTVIANCGVEMVIFDTPPLLGLSDVSILASKVDGVLVVVDTTRATKGSLKQIKARLPQTSVQVLGCVANKIWSRRNDSSYYYYSYTEDQAGEEKSKKNGHLPSIPDTPLPAESPSPFQQRFNRN
jgi:Mrp family chromosome partitioning ATPase